MKLEKCITYGIIKAVLALVGIYFLAYLFLEIKIVFLYFGISIVLALVGSPIVNFLKKYFKLNNNLASILTILIFVVVLTAMFSLFVPLINQQAENLSSFNNKGIRDGLHTLIEEEIVNFMNIISFNEVHMVSDLLDVKSLVKSATETIPTLLNNFISILSEMTIGAFSVLFITFFLLKEQDLIRCI